MENTKTIFILGCGALGSNVAMNLAFDLKGYKLVLVDFDRVEARNYQFGTQQYTPDQDGQLKIDALTINMFKQARKPMGEIERRNLTLGRDGFNFTQGDLLIDCLDNFSARDYVKSIAGNTPCLHAGFSPSMTFEISWNENYKAPDDILGSFDLCEAEGARSFIQYVAGLVTNTTIEFIKKSVKLELVGNRFNVTKIV